MKHRSNGDSVQTQSVLEEENTNFVIALPERKVSLSQDQEWCVVRLGDSWREIRFHDYNEVYEVPGLYEHLFYTTLGCNSPKIIVSKLDEHMKAQGVDPTGLRVLDLGAGNGMVAEDLRDIGAEAVIGVDIFPEAAMAAERDRPGAYEEYLVADMTDLTPEQEQVLRDFRCNALTCVAALGFGDIPIEAFRASFNLVDNGGWIAFNIRDLFLQDEEPSGFSLLIRSMIDEGIMDVIHQEKYIHRYSTSGTPLEYMVVIGRKNRDA